MASESAEDIGCHNCPKSACCRAGITSGFTRKAAAFIERGGTELLPLGGSRDDQEYAFITDCGHLGTDPKTGHSFCTQHDNPERPPQCEDFVPGSTACRLQRHLHNVVPSGFNLEDFLRGE